MTHLTSAFPPTATSLNLDEAVETELTRLLYRQAPLMLLGFIGTTSLMAWVFWSHVDQLIVMAWLGVAFLLTILRAVLLWCYRFRPAMFFSTHTWNRIYAFTLFLSGCLWGAIGVLFFVPEQPALFMLITLLLIGVVSYATIALYAHWPTFYGAAIPALLPFIASCWFYGGEELKVMAVLLLFYLLAAIVYSHMLYATIKKSVLLQFENLDLVEQLRKEKKQIEAADRAKTRFLAAASHDLRQPIHALSLFTAGLEHLVVMPELKREPLQQATRELRGSINGLGALLGSLLDISRLDAHLVEVHPQPLAVQPLLEDLRRDLGQPTRVKNLRLSVIKSSLVVISDPALLRQILSNLASNALRYTVQGGIVIGCRRRGHDIEIQVWDSGMGIPETEINAIFDEFYQLHNAERDREQGLGLGLAIVRRSAQLLGHEVKVRSVVGKGSMFSITLPRSASAIRAEIQIPAMPMSAAMPSPENFSVLVVDDDKDVLIAMDKLIRAWGYSVVAMPSAATALAALDQQPEFKARLGLMLVDSQLAGGLKGMDAAATITQHMGRIIPAVIITGDTSPQGMRDVLASGLRVLHKPLDAQTIKTLIAEAKNGA